MTKKGSVDWHKILPDPEEEELFDGYVILPEFNRDFKGLRKKYPRLGDDLKRFIQGQLKLHHLTELENQGTHELTYVDPDDCRVFKTTKFACMDLGGGANSGIRVIHAYYPGENTIEFIEIYYKGDKKNEDRDRIKKHYS